MSRFQRLERLALVARRLQSQPPVARRRPRSWLASSPRARALVASGLLCVLLLASATPARAQLTDWWAAAQVVLNMGSLVTQMTAIKSIVENQRDQFRLSFYGKIAPLASRMRVVNCYLAALNGRQLGFDQCSDTDYDPLIYQRADGQPVLESVPFNETLMDVCAPGSPPSAICYQRPVEAATVAAVGTAVRGIAAAGYTHTTVPAHVAQRHARQAQMFDDASTIIEDAGNAFEDRIARHRAVVDSAMAIAEEWRGCQPLPVGGSLDTTDNRLPCVTNEGNGRNATDGTVGMVQEIAAQLQLIEEAQEGDATQNQLDTMSAQVAIMQARLTAAMLEMSAAGAEDGQAAQLQRENDFRRAHEVYRLRMDCIDGRSGEPANPFNLFIPDQTGPAGGTCIGTPGAP